MSFDWNLSSDEEDLEGWEKEREKYLNLEGGNEEKKEQEAIPPFAKAPDASNRTNDKVESEGGDEEAVDWGDDDDDEEVDWEDADDDEMNETESPTADADQKPAAVKGDSLKAVTIDLNRKESPKQKKRKRIQRKKFRLETLPHHMQSVLRNLHRSHLLALTSRAVFISQLCSEPELMGVAYSLMPEQWTQSQESAPTLPDLKSFCSWYFDLVHGTEQRRQMHQAANLAAGAPDRRQRRQWTSPSLSVDTCVSSLDRLLDYATYLSPTFDQDPQLYTGQVSWAGSDVTQLLIAMARSLGWRARFVQSMDPIKSDLDVNHPLLSASQNVFQSIAKSAITSKKRKVKTPELDSETEILSDRTENLLGWVEILCQDAKAKCKYRWIHVDTVHRFVNRPDQVEVLLHDTKKEDSARNKKKRATIAYALAVEHYEQTSESLDEVIRIRLTDVTPRYAKSYVDALRLRGTVRGKKSLTEKNLKNTWWARTLKQLNEAYRSPHDVLSNTMKSPPSFNVGSSQDDAIVLDDSDEDKKMPAIKQVDSFEEIEQHEEEDLKEAASNEVIPTSKAGFKSHPIYAIASQLGKTEVIAPDANKRVCGVFKGEIIYRRTDVSTALPAKKWLYQGRKVREPELKKPIKRVKARKKPPSKGFKALKTYGVGNTNDGSEEQRARDIEQATQPLEDGMENLYAIWQTEPWSPDPVNRNDPIPVNEYKNIELELLNPGLVHIDERGAAAVAKKLGLPYAPCLLGFEGHGGNRTPTIRGIVVHQHNEQLVREASMEVTSYQLEEEHESRRKAIYLRWKKLMVGLLTKERLEREYGDES